MLRTLPARRSRSSDGDQRLSLTRRPDDGERSSPARCEFGTTIIRTPNYVYLPSMVCDSRPICARAKVQCYTVRHSEFGLASESTRIENVGEDDRRLLARGRQPKSGSAQEYSRRGRASLDLRRTSYVLHAGTRHTTRANPLPPSYPRPKRSKTSSSTSAPCWRPHAPSATAAKRLVVVCASTRGRLF